MASETQAEAHRGLASRRLLEAGGTALSPQDPGGPGQQCPVSAPGWHRAGFCPSSASGKARTVNLGPPRHKPVKLSEFSSEGDPKPPTLTICAGPSAGAPCLGPLWWPHGLGAALLGPALPSLASPLLPRTLRYVTNRVPGAVTLLSTRCVSAAVCGVVRVGVCRCVRASAGARGGVACVCRVRVCSCTPAPELSALPPAGVCGSGTVEPAWAPFLSRTEPCRGAGGVCCACSPGSGSGRPFLLAAWSPSRSGPVAGRDLHVLGA